MVKPLPSGTPRIVMAEEQMKLINERVDSRHLCQEVEVIIPTSGRNDSSDGCLLHFPGCPATSKYWRTVYDVVQYYIVYSTPVRVLIVRWYSTSRKYSSTLS